MVVSIGDVSGSIRSRTALLYLAVEGAWSGDLRRGVS